MMSLKLDRKFVFVVTHGDKGNGPDPPMTDRGFRQVTALRSAIPFSDDQIREVWAGEAKRHNDVVYALGLENHPNRWWSAVWGACGSLERRGDTKMMVFADGREVPFERTTSGADGTASVKAKLVTLPGRAVVCAGREVLVALGVPLERAKSGALYCVSIVGNEIAEVSMITNSDDVD